MRKTIFFIIICYMPVFGHYGELGGDDIDIKSALEEAEEKAKEEAFFPEINIWEKTQKFEKHPSSPSFKINPYRVSDIVHLDDVTVAAMLLNTECAGCSYNEKLAIIEVVAYRAEYCYRDWGSVKEQIFAPAQFSGVVNGNSCYYFINGKNNPELSSRFYYDPEKKYHLENWNAAYEILILGRRYFRCDMTRFAVISKSTDRKQALVVSRTAIKTPPFFQHTFSFNKNFSFCKEKEKEKTKIASMI